MEVVVAVRLQVVAVADAGVGLDRDAAARLVRRAAVAIRARAAAARAVERVVAAELVAHFVRHVVDVEAVGDRRARAREPARLRAAADHAEARDAAAARADQVADVVVRRADLRVDRRLVRGEVAGGVRVRIRRGIGEQDEVLVRDEHHAHGDLALVDAVDAVDRRDDRAERIELRAAVEDRVLAGRRHREPVRAQRGARGHVRCRCARVARGDRFARHEADAALAAMFVLGVGDVVVHVAAAIRIDVGRAFATDHLRVEALRRQVEAHRRGRVVDALAEPRADLRIARGETRFHHGRFDDAERRVAAVRARQLEQRFALARATLRFRRRGSEDLLQAPAVEREHAIAVGDDLARAARRGQRRFRHFEPRLVGRDRGARGERRDGQDGARCQQREGVELAHDLPQKSPKVAEHRPRRRAPQVNRRRSAVRAEG